MAVTYTTDGRRREVRRATSKKRKGILIGEVIGSGSSTQPTRRDSSGSVVEDGRSSTTCEEGQSDMSRYLEIQPSPAQSASCINVSAIRDTILDRQDDPGRQMRQRNCLEPVNRPRGPRSRHRWRHRQLRLAACTGHVPGLPDPGALLLPGAMTLTPFSPSFPYLPGAPFTLTVNRIWRLWTYQYDRVECWKLHAESVQLSFEKLL